MISVSVAYHKDGDLLIVESVPWWGEPLEWIFYKLFCPYGWLAEKWEWYAIKSHNISDKVIDITQRNTKELYTVPIESGCAATKAIFGQRDICWREECEVHKPS